MIVFQLTILILFAAILGTALSQRFHLPLELTLLVGSLVIALIPGVPALHLKSEVIFYILLPPILFAAAYFTSWNEFKRNLRPISFLAFGLVIFTVCGMAVVIKWLAPSLTWPMAFLFGAIVSPPDASAAAPVIRKARLPRRLLGVLEGESLVNDATALVCYRFALAALASGEFHIGASVGQLLLVAIGGVAVGLAVTHVLLRVLLRIGDTSSEALLTLITAFVCYFVAESLHLSGVIATVAGGLYAGRALPRWASPETRVEARALWNVVLMAVNALVFTMIGLQLPAIIHELGDVNYATLSLWALILTAAIIAIRFIWVFPATWLPRAVVPGLAKRDPMPPMSVIVVMGWVGMRGIVSLAAALAIPDTLPDGSSFAERPLIIFLSYAVILLTLVIPTVTLPGLLRLLKIEDPNEREDDEAKARVEMARAATERIAALRELCSFGESLVGDLLASYQRQIERLAPNLEDNAYSVLDPTDQQRRKILLELFESERQTLHELRSRGDLYDDVYHRLSDELDLEALRVRRNMRPM